MLMNGENFGVPLIISLCACLGKSSDTKSEPQNSVKGSGAGLRLLAVTPESRGCPQRVAMYCLCREELRLALPSTWAPAKQHILGCTCCFSGSESSCPDQPGKASPLRGTESLRGPQTMAFKKFSDSGQNHVFCSCKTKVGTLSSNQG